MVRLNPETHRLSSLPGVRHPQQCQRCGHGHNLTRWQEHDHNDRPDAVLVVLCEACGRDIVEKHPRLYRGLHKNTPWPGCMTICVDCVHRKDTNCGHPQAKANGGTGVMLSGMGEPTSGFIDGRDRSGKRIGERFTWYPQQPTNCKQRQ